jgi:hypothetical protein
MQNKMFGRSAAETSVSRLLTKAASAVVSVTSRERLVRFTVMARLSTPF